MKKIPTLFIRQFEDHQIAGITDEVYPGMEWVMRGEGKATVKIDGACSCIIEGKFYVRYDAKLNKNGNRKPIPEGAIPCQDKPDPITGHLPCWNPVLQDNPGQKWFREAYRNAANEGRLLRTVPDGNLLDHTYEVIGPHFQGNPYHLEHDTMVPHGTEEIAELNSGAPRTFEEIREWLKTHEVEGIVFWKDGVPQCKIKRKDFGFIWNKR